MRERETKPRGASGRAECARRTGRTGAALRGAVLGLLAALLPPALAPALVPEQDAGGAAPAASWNRVWSPLVEAAAPAGAVPAPTRLASRPQPSAARPQISEPPLMSAGAQAAEPGLAQVATVEGLQFAILLPLRWDDSGAAEQAIHVLNPNGDRYYSFAPAGAWLDPLPGAGSARVSLDDLGRRAFFEEGLDAFSFGGLANGAPFQWTRLAHDASGEPAALRAGARFSGRVGDWALAAIGVRTARQGEQAERSLVAARGSLSLSGGSSLGWIATYADDENGEPRALWGADLRLRSPQEGSWGPRETTLWAQRSAGAGQRSHANAYGLSFAYAGSQLRASAELASFGHGFRPELGVLGQAGVLQYRGAAHYRYAPEQGALRSLQSGMQVEAVSDLGGALHSAQLRFDLLQLETRSGDQLQLRYAIGEERLDAATQVAQLAVPGGRHRNQRASIRWQGASSRRLRPELGLQFAHVYGGSLREGTLGFSWRPTDYLRIAPRWVERHYRLPSGTSAVRSAQLELALSLSSWTLSSVFAYNSASERLDVRAALTWTLGPGRELALAWNSQYDADGYGLRHPNHSAVLRLAYQLD